MSRSQVRSPGETGTAGAVRLIRPDDAAWDAALAQVPGSAFHTAGYHRFARSRGLGEPFLAIIGDDARGLAWPYLLRDIGDVPGLEGCDATDVSSVYGYPGPVAWGGTPGDGFARQAWLSLVDTWRRQHVVSVFTRLNPLLQNAAILGRIARELGADADGTALAGATVSVDLTSEPEAIGAEYPRDLRRAIAVGRRNGLTTSHDEAWAHIGAFSLLYRDTMLRLGASPDYHFRDEELLRLRAELDGRLHLLVTHVGAFVAAAGLVIEHGGVVELYLTGWSDLCRDISPGKVLVDDAITWARQRGNSVLHLGGGRGGHQDSLFRFKSRFSSRRHSFHTFRWILQQDLYEQLEARRCVSLPAPDRIDPGFFPIYRAPQIADPRREPAGLR